MWVYLSSVTRDLAAIRQMGCAGQRECEHFTHMCTSIEGDRDFWATSGPFGKGPLTWSSEECGKPMKLHDCMCGRVNYDDAFCGVSWDRVKRSESTADVTALMGEDSWWTAPGGRVMRTPALELCRQRVMSQYYGDRTWDAVPVLFDYAETLENGGGDECDEASDGSSYDGDDDSSSDDGESVDESVDESGDPAHKDARQGAVEGRESRSVLTHVDHSCEGEMARRRAHGEGDATYCAWSSDDEAETELIAKSEPNGGVWRIDNDLMPEDTNGMMDSDGDNYPWSEDFDNYADFAAY
eukprot:Opistho-1_new@32358